MTFSLFLIIYRTRILVFYLWSFFPKNNDFVVQVAYFHNKVTIFFPNPQIGFHFPQLENFLSGKTCFAICGLSSPKTCQIPPYVVKILNSTYRNWYRNLPLGGRFCHRPKTKNSPHYPFRNLFYPYSPCYCWQLSASKHYKHTFLLSPMARWHWEFDALSAAHWCNPQTHRHGASTMHCASK